MKQFKLPKSLNEWEHVSVSWEDIFEHSERRKSSDFMGEIKPCIRRTSGYVLQYTDDYLVIASTDDRSNKQNPDDDDCETVTQFPLSVVRRITRK